MQIKVSMGGLSIYCCTETTILHGYDQNIQEAHGTICPGIFPRDLNALIYRINVIRKLLLCADCEGVIYISFPQRRGMGDVLRALTSKSSIYKFATMGLIGEPMAAPSSCS